MKTKSFGRIGSTFSALLLSAALGLWPQRSSADEPVSTSMEPEELNFRRETSDPPREPNAQMVARSVELYNEGAAHAKAGRLKDAYFAFRDAYELDGSAESLANAAVIEAKLGRPRTAAEHLDHAIGRLTKGRDADEQALRQRLDEVSQEIATVRVLAIPQTHVEIDGKWVGSGPFQRNSFLEPGSHELYARALGGEIRQHVTIPKGGKVVFAPTEADFAEAQRKRREAAEAVAFAAAQPPPGPPSRFPLIMGSTIAGLAAVGGIGLGVYLRAHDERVKIEQQTLALGGFCGTPPTRGFVDDCRAKDQEATNETIGMVIALSGLGLAGRWAERGFWCF